MDEQVKQELAEIRQILKDSLEQGRQTNQRIDQISRQQAQFQDSLGETRALQQQNAEAISQQLEMISQMRQTIVTQNQQVQTNRAEIARIDSAGNESQP